MKRLLLYVLTFTLLGSTSSHALYELGENNGVNNNPHNLSSSSLNPKRALTQAPPGKETEICIFCHAPHAATYQSSLWDRPNPIGPNGNGTFPILTNPNLGIDDAGIVATTLYSTAGDYPNGSSKLCLSCHDGVTAMGVLSDNTSIAMIGTGLAMKIELNLSHPVSFVYTPSVVTYLVGLGKSYKSPATASYLDGSNRVQCTACHQPHKNTKAINTYPFWRNELTPALTAYNTVCNECHTAPPTVRTEHAYP